MIPYTVQKCKYTTIFTTLNRCTFVSCTSYTYQGIELVLRVFSIRRNITSSYTVGNHSIKPLNFVKHVGNKTHELFARSLDSCCLTKTNRYNFREAKELGKRSTVTYMSPLNPLFLIPEAKSAKSKRKKTDTAFWRVLISCGKSPCRVTESKQSAGDNVLNTANVHHRCVGVREKNEKQWGKKNIERVFYMSLLHVHFDFASPWIEACDQIELCNWHGTDFS